MHLPSRMLIMRKFSSCKEIGALVSKKVDQGWLFQNGKRHGKLISPFGPFLRVPCSPSDKRAFQNFRRDMKAIEREYLSAYKIAFTSENACNSLIFKDLMLNSKN